jgi:chemotaxis protein histidine kinase CheA
METAMADDDWNEIDVESAQDGDDKVEYEVEETVTEEKAKPVVESDESFVEVDESAPDPDPVEAAPELEGVDTDGAQKRIRQLVRQRKEREEQIIAQQQELAALQARLQETEQKNAEVFKKNYDVTERQLREKSEMARQAYLRAYDDGDKEAMLAAQEAMFDAKQNIKLGPAGSSRR